jgi:zinc transporter ZupT
MEGGMTTPVWAQAVFVAAAIATAIDLVVSVRRRRWVTLLGRFSRDEQPARFWWGMAAGVMIFLMFFGLAIGSVSQGVLG